MGTFKQCQENIKSFCCETLFSFCNDILEYDYDCLLQGNLKLIFDKRLAVDLTIDECFMGTSCDAKSETSQRSSQKPSPKLQASDEHITGINRFLSTWLVSFCKNIVQFEDVCSIFGELCITLDKEDAVLIKIQEIVHKNKTSLQNHNGSALINSLPKHALNENVYDHKRPRKKNVIEQLIEESFHASDKESGQMFNYDQAEKPIASEGPSKRKRKQSNPMSLSSLDSNPKVVRSTCEEDGVKRISKFLNQSNECLAQNHQVSTNEQQNVELNQNQVDDIFDGKRLSSKVPLMVQLLEHRSTKFKSILPKTHYQRRSPLLTSLNSTPASMGNLDILAERVSMVSQSNGLDDSTSQQLANNNLILKSNLNACDQNSISVTQKTALVFPTSLSKRSRYANALSDIPDDDVHRMLLELITSGQSKESCDAKQCSICCPTLAYIRFRDRNRKNKSRFSMEKIEEVVNVTQYGGGSSTKYRDVQRMFTTHLRKLRAMHICAKKCSCCTTLLIRESKKPNSNYLPHNVTPHKTMHSAGELIQTTNHMT